MRTTLTLDPDVAAELARRRREHNRSLKQEVNDLLRVGLRHVDSNPAAQAAPFRTAPASVGRLLIADLDDIEGALAHTEGDAHR